MAEAVAVKSKSKSRKHKKVLVLFWHRYFMIVYVFGNMPLGFFEFIHIYVYR